MKQSITPQEYATLKFSGKTILVGGCFDILHDGHIHFLTKAKEQGDILVVALESDASVKRRKGESRPINSQRDRALQLLNSTPVDIVLLLSDLPNDQAYFELVQLIKPHVVAITKGDRYLSQKQQQADLVDAKLVIVTSRIGNFSTTNIINNND